MHISEEHPRSESGKKAYSPPKLSRFGQVRQLTAGGSGLTNEAKGGPVKNARP